MADSSTSSKLLQRYRESVQADLAVLENARRILLDHVPGARATVQRVARSLLDASVAYGFHEIARAAAALERATENNLPERLDALLLMLDEIVSTGREPQCARVLLVGRLSAEREILERLPAGPGHELYLATTALQAEELLLQHRFALAVVNLCLPDADGRAFVERLRSNPRASELPILVVCGAMGPHLEDELAALGASAVFTRPVDPEAFTRAAQGLLETPSPDTSSQPLSRRRDPLTRLLTRHAFSVSFQRALNLARSAGLPLWFALVRIDDIQPLVNVHGPRIREDVLRRSARLVRDTLTESDLSARWRGDEFAILVLNRKRNELPPLFDRLLATLRGQPYETGAEHPAQLSFSCGVVRVDEDTSLRETSLRAARLLSIAKDTGPGQLLFEDTIGPPPGRSALVVLPNDLIPAVVRHHLEEEGFVVVHQTVLDEALPAARAMERVDLILVDATIDRAPGVLPVRALRSLDRLSDTPMILVVEPGDEDSLRDGLRFGATDYLTKPFSAHDLLSRLHFVLTKHEMRPNASDPPAQIPNSPLLDALIRVARTRLAAGEGVELPHLGRLEVEYQAAALQRDESGRTTLQPPHNTVRLRPSTEV